MQEDQGSSRCEEIGDLTKRIQDLCAPKHRISTGDGEVVRFDSGVATDYERRIAVECWEAAQSLLGERMPRPRGIDIRELSYMAEIRERLTPLLPLLEAVAQDDREGLST